MAITAAASKLGYSDVTCDQRLVIERFLSGSGVFVSFLTGSGKSLCYSMLPFASNILRGKEGSIVLVVTDRTNEESGTVVGGKRCLSRTDWRV